MVTETYPHRMITKVAYDAGHSWMTSKKANYSGSDDSNEVCGVSDFWTRNTRGVSVAATSTASRHVENPLDTLGEKSGER